MADYWEFIRYKALRLWGDTPACVCCGLTERDQLELDHIFGGGNEHRRLVGNVYSWALLNAKEAKTLLRPLCVACHKRVTKKGECRKPDHQGVRRETARLVRHVTPLPLFEQQARAIRILKNLSGEWNWLHNKVKRDALESLPKDTRDRICRTMGSLVILQRQAELAIKPLIEAFKAACDEEIARLPHTAEVVSVGEHIGREMMDWMESDKAVKDYCGEMTKGWKR